MTITQLRHPPEGPGDNAALSEVERAGQSFPLHPGRPTHYPRLQRFGYRLKALYRSMRVTRFVTWIVGHQYTPSPDLIEIDLTYLCNLRCNNCNRSSAQAPEALHLDLSAIQRFVSASVEQQRRWRRVRLLGGEPTLHPQFLKMISALEPLRALQPSLVIEVVTNGYGKRVNEALAALPPHVRVENSLKSPDSQLQFAPFNMAPVDRWFHRWVDYRNGCDIPRSCGIGLTPLGYYPCALAGGIDRVAGTGTGRAELPASDDAMRDLMARNCQLCGRFRDGHYIPPRLRRSLSEQQNSPTWDRIYTRWRARREGKNDHAD